MNTKNAGKMIKKRYIVSAVIFLAVLTAFNLVMNYLMIPYSFTRMKVHYLETETYDDLILGASHAGTNINASVMAEITGRRTFNAGQGEQYPVDSYYLLRDACLGHKPERVIYEFDPTYWLVAQEIDSAYAGMFYEMRMSPVKVRYFFDKMVKADFRTWTAPWYFYRRQIGDISTNLYTKTTENYKQFGADTFDSETQTVHEDGFISVKPGKWEDEITVREWSDRTIQKDDEKFFIRIAELCQKEGIELVVVTTPVPMETYEAGKENFEAAYAHMEEFADRYGFTYLCYNKGELMDESLMNSEYFADWDGHMYGDRADAFTEVLAGDLQENQTLTK